jgi:2-hydroxychromene-2-carboxylate isomerase
VPYRRIRRRLASAASALIWKPRLRESAMQRPRVRIYTDYKSPYAFVANRALFELELSECVELEWLPYTLRIPEFMGTVEERTPHFWRKARYLYMDARRFANAQGLTLKGPKRIYDAFYSSAGMLFAQRHGIFRPYRDTVFKRFWNHELELDELSQISGVIAELGGSASEFEAYVNGPARAEHDAIIAEAESLGVFGVPTMVFNGELFWGGDRIPLLVERIRAPDTIKIALGSRQPRRS